MKITKEKFFEKYQKTPEEFQKMSIPWDELVDIHDDYIEKLPNFRKAVSYLSEQLRDVPLVHSVRARTKDPEHLVEKIIRKHLENPSRIINRTSYKTEITDLIGIRALHLFKEDWLTIHEWIQKNWKLSDRHKIIANIRKGDDGRIEEQYRQHGCDVALHKAGYRSIHYIIEFAPGHEKYFAELQVRTVFEEAWSEIDHQVRYPYFVNDRTVDDMLQILNRIVGSADEMGSLVRQMKANYEESLNNRRLLTEELEQLRRAEESKDHLSGSSELIPMTVEQINQTITPSEEVASAAEVKLQSVAAYSEGNTAAIPEKSTEVLPDTKQAATPFNGSSQDQESQPISEKTPSTQPSVTDSKASGTDITLPMRQHSEDGVSRVLRKTFEQHERIPVEDGVSKALRKLHEQYQNTLWENASSRALHKLYEQYQNAPVENATSRALRKLYEQYQDNPVENATSRALRRISENYRLVPVEDRFSKILRDISESHRTTLAEASWLKTLQHFHETYRVDPLTDMIHRSQQSTRQELESEQDFAAQAQQVAEQELGGDGQAQQTAEHEQRGETQARQAAEHEQGGDAQAQQAAEHEQGGDAQAQQAAEHEQDGELQAQPVAEHEQGDAQAQQAAERED